MTVHFSATSPCAAGLRIERILERCPYCDEGQWAALGMEGDYSARLIHDSTEPLSQRDDFLKMRALVCESDQKKM
jgi:hypothetical protein